MATTTSSLHEDQNIHFGSYFPLSFRIRKFSHIFIENLKTHNLCAINP